MRAVLAGGGSCHDVWRAGGGRPVPWDAMSPFARNCLMPPVPSREELSDDKVWVAIAPDALSADKDIAPDDFQVCTGGVPVLRACAVRVRAGARRVVGAVSHSRRVPLRASSDCCFAPANPATCQMMKLTDFDENYGAICVDGQVRGAPWDARIRGLKSGPAVL